MNYTEFSIAVGEWSEEQFGEQEAANCLMGASEELGELTRAFEEDDRAEVRDALGDIFLYLCDYAHREGIEFPEKTSQRSGRRSEHIQIDNLASSIGRLHHAQLKQRQGIRQDEWRTSDAAKSAALHDSIAYLEAYADTLDWSLEQIVKEVGEEVLDREW